MQSVVEYEHLLPYQFAARIEAPPLVYVPVGFLEWHGEHMALDNAPSLWYNFGQCY
jgi:hypothetical protein